MTSWELGFFSQILKGNVSLPDHRKNWTQRRSQQKPKKLVPWSPDEVLWEQNRERKKTEEKESRGIAGHSVCTLISSKVTYRIQLSEFSHKPAKHFLLPLLFRVTTGRLRWLAHVDSLLRAVDMVYQEQTTNEMRLALMKRLPTDPFLMLTVTFKKIY